MPQSILVTGGCGFIGSNIAVALASRGEQVTCLDNLSRRGSEVLLERVTGQGCTFVHGDIRCPEDLAALEGDYDVLIECAAEPSVLAGSRGAGARAMINHNLLGAINCFEFARERDAAVIFLSSSRVYPYDRINALDFDERPTRFVYADDESGISENGVRTDFRLEGRRSLYGATKVSAEYLLQEYCAGYGLRAIINRCGVVAGPWQLGKVDQGVFTFWLLAHHFERPLNYIGFGGKGKQVRDLLHIDDLVELVSRQIDAIGDHSGEVFNAGGSTCANLSLIEATELCREITGHRIEIGSEPATRPADVIWFVTDNGETERTFQWSPRRDARMVLDDTYRWLHDNEAIVTRLFGR